VAFNLVEEQDFDEGRQQGDASAEEQQRVGLAARFGSQEPEGIGEHANLAGQLGIKKHERLVVAAGWFTNTNFPARRNNNRTRLNILTVML